MLSFSSLFAIFGKAKCKVQHRFGESFAQGDSFSSASVINRSGSSPVLSSDFIHRGADVGNEISYFVFNAPLAATFPAINPPLLPATVLQFLRRSQSCSARATTCCCSTSSSSSNSNLPHRGAKRGVLRGVRGGKSFLITSKLPTRSRNEPKTGSKRTKNGPRG